MAVQHLLRSLWSEPRSPNPPPRMWWDWALVAALALVTLLEGALRPDLPWRVGSVIMVVGLAAILLWRRTRPLLMIAIAFTVTGLAPLLSAGATTELYTMVYLLLLPYSLVRWGSGRETVIGSAIMIGKAVGWAALGYLTVADTVGGVAVLCCAGALGAASRYRARAKVRELDQVKLLERERLARDLHDTVAHHVSAMAIRAQAGLAVAASRPSAATEALVVIEAEASRALAEMRAMVGVLRADGPADRAPAPRLSDLERLTAGGAAGPAVDLQMVGDLDDVPSSVGTAIYHLAQESITNARRHARNATRITVRVVGDDTSVRLRVTDDGDPAAGRPAASPGYGLIGMIERVDLLGGVCRAGPNTGRGWTVTAMLPRAGATA